MPFVHAWFPAHTKINIPAAEYVCRQTLNEIHPGNSEVSLAYSKFVESFNEASASGKFTAQDMMNLFHALQFTADKHRWQTRKNKAQSPYIIHPMGVARHILAVGNVTDVNILIAALLHDTVEDTDTTFEEIEQRFGPVVAGYIREVTDDKSLPKEVRKELQIEHAPHKSPGAAIIKLADKHYNLTDLLEEPPVEWAEERVSAYFEWAKKVVDALPDVNPALKKAVDDAIAARR